MSRTAIPLAILFSCVFMVSCLTLPGKPPWVSSPPEEGPETVYFVGVGSDPAGDTAAADEQAKRSLVAEVTRYLGVRVTSETTVEARATLDAYTASVTEMVNQRSEARISDLRITEQHSSRGPDGEVVVYLLGAYRREALLAEKQRLAEVFAERLGAIARPEAEGDRLSAEGRPYEAALRYLEAAAAAAGSEVDNAVLKLENNLNKAREALNRINLVALTREQQTEKGAAFAELFRTKVVVGAASADIGVAGASLSVVYKEMRAGGGLDVRTATITTDADGIASFSHPAPRFTGTEVVAVSLDLRAYLEPLRELRGKTGELLQGLQSQINDKRVLFEYVVTSNSQDVPTGVLFFDLLEDGRPTPNSATAAGLLEVLAERGFTLRSLQQDSGLLSVSDREMLQRVAKRDGEAIERVLYGTAFVSAVEESGGVYIVRVEGAVKVGDLETGGIIYSSAGFRTGRGRSVDAATTAAFRGLGENLGEELARGLP